MAKGKKYTQEFKDSAIQLALNSKDSVSQIAKDLEIHEKTLYGWLSDYRKKHNLEISHLISEKSGSIESIEEENRRLRDIPKILCLKNYNINFFIV
jgi:transposase